MQTKAELLTEKSHEEALAEFPPKLLHQYMAQKDH